jgi:F-type H+-transporting ATPase subunit b
MNAIDIDSVIVLASGAAPVVDIDGTMFIQLGIFLVLMALLHPLLFKPWLETQARRAVEIDGAFKRADGLRERADGVLADYKAKKRAIEQEALEAASVSRRSDEGARQERLATARAEATAYVETERVRIAKEGASARAALQGRVDELAQHVANKLLRRAS